MSDSDSYGHPERNCAFAALALLSAFTAAGAFLAGIAWAVLH